MAQLCASAVPSGWQLQVCVGIRVEFIMYVGALLLLSGVGAVVRDRDKLVGRGEATIGFGVDVGRSISLSKNHPVAKCSSECAAALCSQCINNVCVGQVLLQRCLIT